MVLLSIQCEISREKIDNFINKTVGAAKIRHLVMERWPYDISKFKVSRAKELWHVRKSNVSFFLAKIIWEGLWSDQSPESFQGHSEWSEKTRDFSFWSYFGQMELN